MVGYIKKIALIKKLRGGFSADGGELSGLVKCESYAGFLKVEASPINLAPLSEGRYVYGITDGKNVYTFESDVFESECQFDLHNGFLCLVFFCHNGVLPIAKAYCGGTEGFGDMIISTIKEQEGAGDKKVNYNDDAIAEVNYYELEDNQSDGTLCKAEKEEKDGSERKENEDGAAFVPQDEGEREGEKDEPYRKKDVINFYESKKGEIEKIFLSYPKDERLEKVMQGSRWAKISYGDGLHYSFGTISHDGEVKFLCYAVPAQRESLLKDNPTPPKSLHGRATFIPVDDGGYWVMYQDAVTGKSVT